MVGGSKREIICDQSCYQLKKTIISYISFMVTIKQKSIVDTQTIKRRESKDGLANICSLINVSSSTFTNKETEDVKMHKSVYGGHTINHYVLLPCEYDNLFPVISTK